MESEFLKVGLQGIKPDVNGSEFVALPAEIVFGLFGLTRSVLPDELFEAGHARDGIRS